MPNKITELPVYSSPTNAVVRNAKVVKAFCDDFYTVLSSLSTPLRTYIWEGAMGFLGYCLKNGIYRERLYGWSKIAGVSPRKLLLVNLMYELSQLGLVSPFGCTSVILNTPQEGIIHVRNMDWELKNMGRTTVIIDTDQYMSVSNPGMLGALSGMVAGEFSITLNWAPPSSFPRLCSGPLFLVQSILENAKTYVEAVSMAEKTPISVPAIFSIAGIDNACVVERIPSYYNTRKMRGRQPLAATNHYVTASMKPYNQYQDSEVNACSKLRYQDALQEGRTVWTSTKSKSFHSVLSTDTTLHDGTIQQMVFYPAEGHYSIIAFDNNDVLES